MVRMVPSESSSQVAYTMDAPSADHDGYNSKWCDALVRRLGVPAGRSLSQICPSAWYITLRWSGDTLTQRSIFTSNESGATCCANRTASVMTCVTRAVNGIGEARPPSNSTLQNFPCAEITMRWPSGAHAYPWYVP